jgi:hypothetical protein
MRKLLVVILLAPIALLVAIASGCGGGDNNPTFKGTVPTELEKKKTGGAGAPKPHVD